MQTVSVGIMDKIIAAFDARRNFGKILQGVVANGDRFIVERHGEKVAAVVPMKVYEQWKKGREEFFSTIEAVSKKINLSEEQADKLSREALQAVRLVHK